MQLSAAAAAAADASPDAALLLTSEIGPIRTTKRTRNLSAKASENSQLSYDALNFLDLESEEANGPCTQTGTLVYAQVHELH